MVHNRTTQAVAESERQLQRFSAQLLLAQEAERRLLARELHDAISQTLAAIKLDAERAMAQLGADLTPAVTPHLLAIISRVQSVTAEVRRMQQHLHPPALEDLSLEATVHWYSDEFATEHPDMRVEQLFDCREPEVPAVLRTAVFRVLQDALTIAARRPGTNVVRVALRLHDRQLELEVTGNGDRPAANALAGDTLVELALATIRERATLSGGFVVAQPPLERGTAVRVVWGLDGLAGAAGG